MPGFEITLFDIQLFGGIELAIDVRVSGTFADLDNWTIDLVEVPSRHDPNRLHNPRDGWRVLSPLHALYNRGGLDDGIGPFLDRRETIDRIEDEIRRLMEDDDIPIRDPNDEHRQGARQLGVGAYR